MARDGRLRSACVALVVLTLILTTAPEANAKTVTFGADLNRVPSNPYPCSYFGYQSCTWESNDLVSGESGFPPIGHGVITRVRVRVGPVTGRMQIVVEEALRTVVPMAYYCCKAVRMSKVFTPRANSITTIRTKLPVFQSRAPNRAGYYVDDHLALSVLDANVPIPAAFDSNSTGDGYFPAWVRGEERAGDPYSETGPVILFNATWKRRA